MWITMHTTSPAVMSLEKTKNCIEDDNDGDVLKQETQDLAGLLSSPDTKTRDNGTPSNIKSEPGTEIKEEIKEEIKVKPEPGNPGSVGKLPNGDAGSDVDKKVGTPGDVKPSDKGKSEPNGNPNTPIMGDGPMQSPAGSMGGPVHRTGSMSVMSPGSSSMGPHMGPMQQGGPQMGPGGGPGQGMQMPPSSMMGPMGPGSSGMVPCSAPNGPMGGPLPGPGPGMGMNGGPMQQQVASEGHLVQQQSEIFVFTTQLANDAAQAVQSGQYKNILFYHMDQPATKTFLQKNPKLRGSPAMFGMQGMRNKMNMMNSPMGPMGGMPGGPGGPMGYGPGPNSSSSVAQWVQQQNQNLQEQGLGGMNDGDPRMLMGPNNPNFQQMMMDDRMFDPDFGGPGGQMNNMNLMQNKVPNENLTPEQLQRREEHLANLRKLQQMLFPEQRNQQGFPPGQGPGGPGGQGMMPGEMGGGMSMYQQNMMASKRAMMSQGMMGSPHGMMDSRQEMMSQEQFMMSQGMSQFGPGPHPQNIQNLSPAQREWVRLQQEYMAEKRAHQQRTMGPNGPSMGPNGPPMGPGQPPPSYYSSIAQKQRHGSVGMGSPTSPNMNGRMGSPSVAVSGPDPIDPMMFPGHQRKGSFSGMDPMSSMGPGMGPGMDPMMQHGSPMNHNMGGHMGNMPPSHGMKNSQVSLQRAGNPEQFVPEMPPGPVPCSNASANKPPPSYAQSQSTKRKRDDMEELCKNLQPTPSPQHISYLNQFDGQELTITKQINTAYRDTNTSESQSSHYTQSNQAVNSPLHAPGSNKGPMSNSSQTSSGALASPGPVTATQGSGQGPGSGTMSGANMRLSHYDPPQQQQPQKSSSISNSPTTPTGKSSLSNITSASLANLAKGVENLSNQMQQHMMQGGPFHSIQMQSQQQQQQQQQGPSSNQGHGTSQPSQQAMNSQPPSSVVAHSSQTSHTTPSVNNTYVNANLSIQQVNIQSVAHGNGNYNSSNTSASMQVQQMNMEQTQMNMQQSGASMSGAVISQSGIMSQSNVTQSTNMTPSSMMSGMPPENNKMHSGNMGMKDNFGGMGPPGMHSSRSPFGQSQNPPVPSTGRSMSPGFPPSSMGNANVQIQQKAPNTIQYLPANQSSMLPENKPMGKPDLDFMNQFAGPQGPSMEGKVPTSKMQYFPGGPGGSPYGPHGGMGPGQGSMGEGRMGPGMGPGMGQDPRFGGQSMSDPRMDPRMGGGDPRMGPMGPGSDPRMSGRPDGRMGPGPDMMMAGDPRMGPGGMGPMSDPRMGPSAGSMMGMGPSSGPMGSMRPGSRGSPFAGPIGPAVQQSMMMRRGSPDLPLSGNFSPDPMNPSLTSMSGPMSALSSLSGNPMTSMSNMSNSIMADTMGPMGGGPPGSMGPNMPYNSPPYTGPMGSPMMPSGPGGMSMQGPRMQGPGMPSMSRAGPYSRQTSPSMRMSGPGGMGGPLSPGAPGYSSAQYQQFQQQLYSQSRPRQMSAMDSMMGNPGGPHGYGPMGPGMGPGMMPNMHGGM